MDFSTDEYFGTLGGSLMKDLLADLQVDDGDFSLEHLERELAQLDHEHPQPQTQMNMPLTAASLVVSHAQDQQSSLLRSLPVADSSNQGMDAWSLSLQNFTALSLQDDFLAADSARKQRQAATGNNRRIPVLDEAEDYDIAERPAIAPPPGLGGPPTMSGPPSAKRFPKTPQNSLALPDNEASSVRNDIMKMVVDGFNTNQGDIDTTPAVLLDPIPQHQPPRTVDSPGLPPPTKAMPPPGVVSNLAGPSEGIPQLRSGVSELPLPPPPGVIPEQSQLPLSPPPGVMPPQVPPFQVIAAAPPPHGGAPLLPGMHQPVLLALPAGGPAWQAPTMPIQNSPPVFCNPHPSAPPVPGAALESKFMSARDVTYVIHSILKPVLAEGVSEDDYHIQYMMRLGGPQANPTKPKQATDINEEMISRENRSKEWSSEKGTLGYVAKTNVARPRALIATPQQPAGEQDSEHKQRASLWKARIYCDQAYQSFQIVVSIWRSASPGVVPPAVQIHSAKLMKCMGITLIDKDYHVDNESLKLLLKLSKGQVLIARVLDLALLPPNAVQAFLPSLSEESLGPTTKSEDPANDRLFRSMSNIVQKLNLTSDTLLNCLNIVQNSGKASLSSTARMEFVHILLRRGSFALSQDPSEQKRLAWSKAENEFIALMQAI